METWKHVGRTTPRKLRLNLSPRKVEAMVKATASRIRQTYWEHLTVL